MQNRNQHHLELIRALKTDGFISTSAVEEAFLAVPRHLFLRHLDPIEAYKNENIHTKINDAGEIISSASHPGVVAQILEQFCFSPGERVLEIGAGTGFNAALIGHLVGEEGFVISLDIDEDIVETARQNLAQTNLKNIQVICSDGHCGYPEGAPYDCIVLSVSSFDVFPSWLEQLRIGGLLGMAIKFYEQEGTYIVFEKQINHLESCAGVGASFMPLRGGLDFQNSQVTNTGEKALREHIQRGLGFNRVLVYPSDSTVPVQENQIILERRWSTFVFQWD